MNLQGQVKGIKDKYTIFIWDLTCENPRTCFIMNKGIDYICISKFLSRDLVTIQLTTDKEGRKAEIV